MSIIETNEMNRKRWVALAAAAGALVVVVAMLGGWVGLANSKPNPKDKPCTDVNTSAQFYAYDSATRGNNFGPAVVASNVKEALFDLHQRICTDAALVTAHAAYFGVDGLSLPMSQKQFEKAVNAALAAPGTVWRQRVEAVEAYVSSGTVSLVTSTKAYDTMFFGKGNSSKDVPDLYAGPVTDRVSTLLVIRHGKMVKNLKLECGFQPFEPEFPGTPKNPPHHPKPTPTPTPTPSCVKPPVPGPGNYEYNPSDCTWHKKSTSWDCQQNGGPNCPPNQATQPPQHNPGQPTGPSGPSKEPSPAPSWTDSSTPPPNDGGYDGGSHAPGPTPSNSPETDPSATPTSTPTTMPSHPA